jgi:hypothetical protein
MISVKGLLVVGLAVATYAYLLTRHPFEESRGLYSYEWRHDPRIGARNHSGIEPYDVFGLRRSEQGRDYDGGRDLPDEGR